MKFSPLTIASVLLIGTGILIIISPEILAYAVAFVLISAGISLMSWERKKGSTRVKPSFRVKD